MKKSVSQLIVMLLFTLPGFAQDKGSSEITASYAMLPSENMLGNLWMQMARIGDNGARSFSFRKGAPFVSYKYYISERIAIGGATGYNAFANESNFRYTDYTQMDVKTITTAGEVTWFYVRKPGIKVYATAGVGFYVMKASFDAQNTSTVTQGMTAQLTPVGVRFGKKVAVFTELGYGYKGVLNTGLSFRF